MVWGIPLTLMKCLFLTVLTELIAARLLKQRGPNLVFVLFTNLLTNPPTAYLVLVFSLRGYDYLEFLIVVLEILVVLIEGSIYKKTLSDSKINPFLLSLILNILSFILCLVVQKL